MNTSFRKMIKLILLTVSALLFVFIIYISLVHFTDEPLNSEISILKSDSNLQSESSYLTANEMKSFFRKKSLPFQVEDKCKELFHITDKFNKLNYQDFDICFKISDEESSFLEKLYNKKNFQLTSQSIFNESIDYSYGFSSLMKYFVYKLHFLILKKDNIEVNAEFLKQLQLINYFLEQDLTIHIQTVLYNHFYFLVKTASELKNYNLELKAIQADDLNMIKPEMLYTRVFKYEALIAKALIIDLKLTDLLNYSKEAISFENLVNFIQIFFMQKNKTINDIYLFIKKILINEPLVANEITDFKISFKDKLLNPTGVYIYSEILIYKTLDYKRRILFNYERIERFKSLNSAH